MAFPLNRPRLFSYWPFPPAAEEPAHGYFLRLVKAQGESSLRNFNIWNQIETENAYPRRMLEDIEAHPMPTAWLEKLRANTPVRDGNFHYLRGHKLRYLQVSLLPRRWCAGCLHDEAYHRAWWDIESIHFCPLHGSELTSIVEGAGGVTWKWLDFEYSSYGIRFGTPMDRIEGSAPYSRYILGRLGWLDPTPVKLLDSLDVSGVIEACEFVGQTLQATTRKKSTPKTKDTAEIGFRALSGTQADLAEAFREKHRTYEDRPDRETINSYFSASHSRLNELPKSMQTYLRRVFREAFVAVSEGLSREIEQSDFEVEFVTTIEAGRRLGMGPRGARQIASVLGQFIGTRQNGTIPVDALGAIDEFRNRLITRDAVRKRLGLPPGTVNHLVRAGFLTMYKFARVGAHTGGMFSPSDVDDILCKIEALPTTQVDNNPCTFFGYFTAYRENPGKLAVACLRGEVPIVSCRRGKTGFNALVLESRPGGAPPRKPSAMPIFREKDTVTMLEAEVLLNLPGPYIRYLVKHGHLSVAKRHAKLTLLHRDRVLQFGAKHAKAADYASCLLLSPKRLGDRVIDSGAVPVVPAAADGRNGAAVFRRADILASLGIETDPTLIDDTRVSEFWTSFTCIATSRCPKLILPKRLPSHEMFIRDRTRTVRVTFSHLPGRDEISCMISPLKAQKIHTVIDLTVEDHEISAERLTDLITDARELGVRNYNDGRRSHYRKSRGAEALS